MKSFSIFLALLILPASAFPQAQAAPQTQAPAPPQTSKPPRVDIGKVEGSVYRNEYFKFSYTFPEDMKLNAEFQKSFESIVDTGLEVTKQHRTAEEAKEIKEAVSTMVPLLMVERHDAETNRAVRIAVMAMNLTEFGLQEVPAEEVEEGLKVFADSMLEEPRKHATFRLLQPNATREHEGRKFGEARYAVALPIMDKQVEMVNGTLITFSGAYILIWQFYGASERSLEDIMKSTANIHFDKQ